MTEEKQESTDFELMDRADEEQILQELRGVPVEKFIYKNSRGQNELSYAGTKWVVRQMANMGEAIRVELPKKERCPIDPEYILVDIIGKRVKIDRDANVETILDSNVGSARGWIKQKLRDGRVVPDEFFYNKTVSKATRNVLQMLIPPDLKREMIARLEKMTVGGGGGPPNRPPQRPQGAPQGAPPSVAPPPQQAQQQQRQQPQQQPQQSRPPAAPPQQNRPAASPPPTRPPTGGFAGEPPFPASPSQGQPQQRPPQRAAAPPPAARPPVQGVPNQTQSRPDQSPRDAALDVLHQRFEVVLKQATGTNDRNQALAVLRALTGMTRIQDLSKPFMQEIAPILNNVAKGIYKLVNNQVVDELTGEIFLPKPQPQAEPMPEPQAEAEPPPQQQPEDAMF